MVPVMIVFFFVTIWAAAAAAAADERMAPMRHRWALVGARCSLPASRAWPT